MKVLKAVRTAVWAVVFLLVITFVIPPIANNFFAGYAQQIEVTVHDQGVIYTYRTGAGTVSDLLLEIGKELSPLDRTSHATHSPLWDGMNLVIIREVEFEIQINHDFVAAQVVMPGLTAGQLLVQQQFQHDLVLLYGGDLTRYLSSGETINFYTWDSRFYTDYQELPYYVIENHTGAVRRGRSHVRQEGIPGEHSVTSAVVIIGGEEQSRDIIGSAVISEPVPAIVDIGTAPLGALTDVTAPDFHYVRHLRMEATAYTAGFSCTGKHPWDPWYRITASGREVEHGIVAVDRNVIPLGTWLYVENYGFALAADVGGAIRGYKIDLFMECIIAARRFGRRHNVNVWILE